MIMTDMSRAIEAESAADDTVGDAIIDQLGVVLHGDDEVLVRGYESSSLAVPL